MNCVSKIVPVVLLMAPVISRATPTAVTAPTPAYAGGTLPTDVIHHSPAPLSAPVNALLLEFKSVPYAFQQIPVAEKLVALGDCAVIPAMQDLLQSEKRSERCNAGLVLAGLGDDRGLQAVLAELRDTSSRPATADSWLRNSRPPQGDVTQDRYYAAHVLRQIGDKRAVPALIEVLQDKTLDYQAAIVLGHLDDQRAVAPLLALVERSSPHTTSRLFAGYGLMGLGHPKGLATVLEFLDESNAWTLRRHAVQALGQFLDKRAVPRLIVALGDEHIDVRTQAAIDLGRIGDNAALPALRGALKDNTGKRGSIRIHYDNTAPSFKAITLHDAAAEAIAQLEGPQG